MKNFKKLFLGLAALVIAFGLVFSVSAFKQKKVKTMAKYWYEVSYDDPTNFPNGYIKTGTPVFDYAEMEEVETPCELGTDLDCLRGFEAPITTFPDDSITEYVIQRPEN